MSLMVTTREKDKQQTQFSGEWGEGVEGVFRLEVTDSGTGLSPDEQRKLFGEFTQFNKNELQGGGDFMYFVCFSTL